MVHSRAFVALLAGLVLCTGIVIVWMTPSETIVVVERGRMATRLPKYIEGWTSSDLPLGETEQVTGKVEKILRFDDVVYRRYSGPEGEFSVYVAYWGPGSITPREVEFHTPDRCWIQAGWTRQEYDLNYQMASAASLGAGQWRRFKAPNASAQEVVFWHVVDGKVVPQVHLDAPGDLSIVADILRYGVAMRREQYFIRISSPMAIRHLSEQAGFQQVLTVLSGLGVAP